ncbi:MAG TPA: penicillin-binding protein [Candidatus Eisenbergiella merdipullorum]|uniref:Penicillin-binding protein n=1 Tax=Candidatus Eisenbergiella merdipullorum TaxID=2838553 RepID=A0A9D2I6Y3_9FIRM|nr:penicillin-binding protein [Candidatus Eisenbergiella merdipullorum]
MLERLRDRIVNFITSRLMALTILFIVMGVVLIQRVFELQIVNGETYQNEFSLQIRRERSIPSSRGNIYDRNGKLLAYNDLAYSVTIEDVYENTNKNANMNATLMEVFRILEANGDEVVSDFNVYLDEDGDYAFSVRGTSLQRFLADVYGYASIDDMDEGEKNSTPQALIDHLCRSYGIGERTDPDDSSTFVPGQGYTRQEVLKLVTVRYAMRANSYQKYIPTTIATDVSEKTVAAIEENKEELTGIDIAEDTIRRYVNGTYFSHIIGYTGKISSEELESLNEQTDDGSGENRYEMNDTVGKSGIESVMETYLQGEKGSETIYVDNLGREIESEGRIEPVAGGNVYLTLDADLQEAVYNILEESIAGILLDKIRNVKVYNSTGRASDIIIPIDDVYFALFNNNVIDMEHLSLVEAGEYEKEVYQAFLSWRERVWNWLRQELYEDRTPYDQLDAEFQAYESYIVNDLLVDDAGVLTVDSQDPVYQQWSVDETLSLSEFLEYAIAQNWVDVTKLDMEESYADSGEVFDCLVDFIIQELDTNTFYKEMYRYMIRNNAISGTQVCMVLIEQNLVSVTGEEEEALLSGSVSSYDFMKELISELQITPAQLALNPYSGSCVVVDPNSGEVLALVSYPSYDNNRLANGIDADYYAGLQSDLSNPLWDYATQMRTAPGSTYKPVVATTLLMEGVTNLTETVDCVGSFTRFADRAFRCWIYPGAHGNLNITEAITHSCNFFFYEMAYRMGTKADGTFDSDLANEKMRVYADLYGLTEKSGIEIEESAPQFSTENAVPSAIGQGNHNYTTVGLARYVATVANSGTCYDLSLLDKVTDHAGNLLEDFTPEVRNTIEMPTSYWDAIHEGMRGVTENKDYFSELSITTAGKTGTAEVTSLVPNHALFVGYAPYDDPEIALAVRIGNGYSSDYASQIGCKVIRYYFGLDEENEIITGGADISEDAGGD